MLSLVMVSLRRRERLLLDRISLSTPSGSVLALVGPNGAGKSTLLRVAAGELPPDEGEVSLDGRDLHTLSTEKLSRLRAVLPQSERLAFAFTVREVVSMGRFPFRRTSTKREDELAITEALASQRLEALSHRSYLELSGGERQRVQIARVLAQAAGDRGGRPEVLFFDEPTSALDLPHQHRLLAHLRGLARAGRSCVVVVHDLNLAQEYATHVALLARGRLEAVGPTEEILSPERLSGVYGMSIERHRVEGRWVLLGRAG